MMRTLKVEAEGIILSFDIVVYSPEALQIKKAGRLHGTRPH